MTAPLFNAFPSQSGAPVLVKRGGWLHADCADDCCCFRNEISVDASRRVYGFLPANTRITLHRGNTDAELVVAATRKIEERVGADTVSLSGDIDGEPFAATSPAFPPSGVAPGSGSGYECEMFSRETMHVAGDGSVSSVDKYVSPCDAATTIVNRVEISADSELEYNVQCPSSPTEYDSVETALSGSGIYRVGVETWSADEPRDNTERFIPARHFRVRMQGSGSGREGAARNVIDRLLVRGPACVAELKYGGVTRTLELGWAWDTPHNLLPTINAIDADLGTWWTWASPLEIELTITPYIP